MNVGPMGNGRWDKRDIEVFQGIGQWLKVNGESIYGAQRTNLPIQPWGVTTLIRLARCRQEGGDKIQALKRG